ncbi:hypothetical protein [Streptomyces sp. NPDC017524]|uniref:hypothetical protein n=1 Tax=unclassified Streptomyces TaxID=2593676 RepID=UPI0037B95F58
MSMPEVSQFGQARRPIQTASGPTGRGSPFGAVALTAGWMLTWYPYPTASMTGR